MNASPDTPSKTIGHLVWRFGIGWLHDYWTLNAQISERNHGRLAA